MTTEFTEMQDEAQEHAGEAGAPAGELNNDIEAQAPVDKAQNRK